MRQMNTSATEPCRILIIDDSPDTARTYQILCRAWGHETRTAGSAEEGLRLLSAFAPDLALVDLSLPGMSGIDLAHAVRKNPAQARTILVAITGFPSDFARIEAFRAGFNEYVAKPIDSDRLHAILNDFCTLAA